jgi:hypothetical protein
MFGFLYAANPAKIFFCLQYQQAGLEERGLNRQFYIGYF